MVFLCVLPWLSSQRWQEAHQQSRIPMCYQQRAPVTLASVLMLISAPVAVARVRMGPNLLLARPGPGANFWPWDLQESDRLEVSGSELECLCQNEGQGAMCRQNRRLPAHTEHLGSARSTAWLASCWNHLGREASGESGSRTFPHQLLNLHLLPSVPTVSAEHSEGGIRSLCTSQKVGRRRRAMFAKSHGKLPLSFSKHRMPGGPA